MQVGPLRVLVIDDEEQVVRTVGRMLQRHGYAWSAATTTVQAREALAAARPPDAVLCDVRLPGESGLSFLEYLRAEYPLLPVVMMSGVGGVDVATWALELGAYGWVTKPFDASQLLIALANAVLRARLEARSAEHEQELERAVAQRTYELRATVAELERSEQRLQHLADHDQLTGLFNRRRFEEELRRELTRAQRYGTQGAVVSIDIDNFKAINDSAGHAAGDAVLREVAGALREHSRASDVVGRIGGDEFGVLVGAVDADTARAAAEHLRAALRGAVALCAGRAFRVTPSIGIGLFGGEESDAHQVLIAADLAMYEAKKSGRDQIVVFTAAEGRDARAMVRLSWAERIRTALERDRFVLHVQPILDLATGELSHGELLLRMLGDRGELISPGGFLAAAERFGFIHAIDHWVVRHAVELLARDARPHRIGVNLSGESVVGDPELLAVIERALSDSAADPARLILEVTETAAIVNMPQARQFAAGLTSLGCSLALDDFGSGFGSFCYLKHLPVGYVKLDGEFIHDLPRSNVDEHMVKAIVEVAAGLGIKTVAECVGDDETIRLLQRHGVDFAQGYHVAAPGPIVPATRS